MMMMQNLSKIKLDGDYESFSIHLSNRLDNIRREMGGVLNELRHENIEDYNISSIIHDMHRVSYFLVILIMDTDVHLSIHHKNTMLQINDIFIDIINIIDSNKNRLIDQCNLPVFNFTAEVLPDRVDKIDVEILNEKVTDRNNSKSTLSNDKMYQQPILNDLFKSKYASNIMISHNTLQNKHAAYAYDKWHDVLNTGNILYVSQYHKDAPD